MGWFDNDKDDKPQSPQPPAAPPPRPPQATAPARGGGGGSTFGERVHVNGTIVCEESLRVLGRIEGTIHARQDLTVMQGADVRAVIHGRRVNIEGTVNGDVHASEVVVLGPSASLMGNIKTPSLQIQEGAFFKGSVEMSPAEPAARADRPSGEPGSIGKSNPGKAAQEKAGAQAAPAPAPGKVEPGGRAAGR
jgi:cytoskeletal protein CcmA (bactofilin family)